MRVLNLAARLVCDHELGHVRLQARQSWVRVGGQPVLVDDDPEKKTINGCPNTNPLVGILPCRTTLAVQQGYSGLIRIGGRRVCTDSVSGMTDGVPATFHYHVVTPGQEFVSTSK